MEENYGGNLIPPHIVQQMIDGMAAYDAKMMIWADGVDLPAPKPEPTIADLFEDFKARVERDEMTGEE